MSVTSTSTIAILTAGILGQAVPGRDSAALIAASATLALLTGLFLLLAGLLRCVLKARYTLPTPRVSARRCGA